MPTLTIIRGIPGSGKSTIAKQMVIAHGHNIAHFESDMFWGSDYNFDINRLSDAHDWCQKRVMETMVGKTKHIVVSNTFTRSWEAKPYVDYAREYGYDVQVIEVRGQWQNIHNVPDSTLQKMRDRWQDTSDFCKDLGI